MARQKFRIKGKIYYKESEEIIRDEDRCLVDSIWRMSNPKGETFRLLISAGKRRYTMYQNDGKLFLRTYSISPVLS